MEQPPLSSNQQGGAGVLEPRPATGQRVIAAPDPGGTERTGTGAIAEATPRVALVRTLVIAQFQLKAAAANGAKVRIVYPNGELRVLAPVFANGNQSGTFVTFVVPAGASWEWIKETAAPEAVQVSEWPI